MEHDDFSIPEPGTEGSNFVKELVTPGEHQAVLCQMHNVGYQLFNNKISASPKVIFVFEMDQSMTGGKMAGQPMVMSKTFPMYMGEGSSLRAFMESWRGRLYQQEELKNFTLKKCLYQPITILVIHEKKKSDGTMKASIAGVLPAKGMVWTPTYLDEPEWIKKEKAKQVYPENQAKPVQNPPAGQPATQPVTAGANLPETDLPF
jgi:hypothetical protein